MDCFDCNDEDLENNLEEIVDEDIAEESRTEVEAGLIEHASQELLLRKQAWLDYT